MRMFYKISDKEYSKYINLFDYEDIVIPKRQTVKSCGYDFVCPYDVTIKANSVGKVYSGIKCEIEDDEFLMLAIRSSKAIKEGLVLANQVGIIDADYYNNEDNEGHIIVGVRNMNDYDVVIKKGDRICQGIILKYGITDMELPNTNVRGGGIGSTGK